MKSECCPRCTVESRLRPREFSEQAIAALVTWGDLESHAIDLSMCEDCYLELREVLIDRADELINIESSKKQSVQKKKKAG